MPTYGYRCPACSAEFDVWQKMSDEAKASCPTCGAEARRIFYPAGIVFKGTGFYATDSRRSTTATAPSANGSASSEASSPASTPGGAPAKTSDKKSTTTSSGD